MSTAKSLLAIPNSSLRRKYEAIFALCRMFLLGRQAMFGHDPPTYWRSITATRCPCLAKVHAAMVDPVPPPRITRSYASESVFFNDWADEVFFVLFIRLFLSERQVHSWCAARHAGDFDRIGPSCSLSAESTRSGSPRSVHPSPSTGNTARSEGQTANTSYEKSLAGMLDQSASSAASSIPG